MRRQKLSDTAIERPKHRTVADMCLTSPENSHLSSRWLNISTRAKRPSLRLPRPNRSRKSSPFASRYGFAAPSRHLPEILTLHGAGKKKPMDSVTYPHEWQVRKCDTGSRITSPQMKMEDPARCEFPGEALLNNLTQAGSRPGETPLAPQ